MNEEREHPDADQDFIDVPIAWEALSDAFENNAPEVQSYLNLATGEVVRLIDDVADPITQRRISHDPEYLIIDPVSSREQYRWMERFIESLENEEELRSHLQRAIDGKGAFRRFKDVLMTFPVDRERWFVFRAQRLRACMESWLQAHSIRAVDRPEWEVPSVDDVDAAEAVEVVHVEPKQASIRPPNPGSNIRREIHELLENLSSRELQAAKTYLEFLAERSHTHHEDRRQSYTASIQPDSAKESQDDEVIASQSLKQDAG